MSPFASHIRRSALLWCALASLSCNDGPTETEVRVPAALDIVSGDAQEGVVGTELGAPLVVRVEDANGLPVVGQLVNFRVTAGGGSVFAGSGITNALGVVQDRWTLGTSTADSQRVEARAVDPNTGARIVFATFRATARPGPAHSVTKAAGDAQQGALGTVLADSLAVRVTDAFGNPVPSVTVTWATPLSNGTVAPATSLTNATGIARTAWTLGSRLDLPHEVTAQVAGLTPARFNASATLPPSATVVKIFGDGVSAVVGTAMAESLAVRVQLANGQPVPGASVTWLATTGSVSPVTSTTQGDGMARTRLTLSTTAGSHVVTASVPGLASAVFTVAGTPDVPASLTTLSGDGQIGTVGQPLAEPLIVEVKDRFGNVVPNATVTWSVTAGGGSVAAGTSVTNLEGRTSMAWTLGGVSGTQSVTASIGSATVAFQATAGSAPATSVRISPTSLRFGTLGSTSSLVARAFDQFGNQVSGVSFTWFTRDPAVATVDAAGRTTARGNGSTWIGARSGSLADSISVTVQQVTGRVHVSPSSAGVVVGDTTRYVATVTDSTGNLIPGATIQWTTLDGSIATVEGAGLARGVRSGETWIVAESERVRDSARVIVLDAFSAAQVSAGIYHSCTVGDDGRSYCWGANMYGQLGIGPADDNVHVPVAVRGSHAFTTIHASAGTTCALEGTVPYCWGNTTGEMRGMPSSGEPVSVGGVPLTSITHGDLHACGLTAAGKAYCWGDNDRGQLGTDTILPSSTPVAVVGNLTFASISAGGRHTCAVTTTGEAYCWGNNAYGELGIGSRDEFGEQCNRPGTGGPYPCRKRPTPVVGGHAFSSISAGVIHTCAIRASDGAMYCWGLNDYGQLGTGPVTANCENRFGGVFACEPSPTAVGDGRGYIRVSAGHYYSCAVATDNSALCWGRNDNGQLGRQTTEQCTDVSRLLYPCGVTPALVSGGLSFQSIDAGYYHSCATTTAREVYCWGDNQFGQLGTGTRTAGGPAPRRVGVVR